MPLDQRSVPGETPVVRRLSALCQRVQEGTERGREAAENELYVAYAHANAEGSSRYGAVDSFAICSAELGSERSDGRVLCAAGLDRRTGHHRSDEQLVAQAAF